MPKVSDVNAVSITLEVDDELSLFILLAADGTINRKGTGSAWNQDHELFIGLSKEPLFSRLVGRLDDEMLEYTGGYDIHEKKGLPCKLMIHLSLEDAEDDGFAFLYGSESEGPPEVIVRFVTTAVELTDPWFEEQKRMVAGSSADGGKPWWKFW